MKVSPIEKGALNDQWEELMNEEWEIEEEQKV